MLSFLKTSIIVFLELNFAFCPVNGSTTIITVPFAALKGLASYLLTESLIKLLKIGKAVLDPVSYFPSGAGLSEPT